MIVQYLQCKKPVALAEMGGTRGLQGNLICCHPLDVKEGVCELGNSTS